MPILTPADYGAVRAALDLSLDARVLPDNVIALDIYLGAAERQILARDPQAPYRSDDDLIRVKNAITFLTAALIAPVVPQITNERLGDQSYTRQPIDWAKRAEELRARAEHEILAVVEPGQPTKAVMPRLFTVAHGRRGR